MARERLMAARQVRNRSKAGNGSLGTPPPALLKPFVAVWNYRRARVPNYAMPDARPHLDPLCPQPTCYLHLHLFLCSYRVYDLISSSNHMLLTPLVTCNPLSMQRAAQVRATAQDKLAEKREP